jgi:hypothetical protein
MAAGGAGQGAYILGRTALHLTERFAQVAQELRCERAFNSLGREAHTMASFFTRHYEELPSSMLFLQGDALIWQHHPAALQSGFVGWSEEQVRAWSHGLHATHGFAAGPYFCLCNLIEEDYYRPCPPGPLDPAEPRCYGDTYWPIRWFAETVLGMDALDELTTLRWPEAAQFAVSSRAVRSRPRHVYLQALSLLNGSAEVPALLQYTARDAGSGVKVYSVFEWAHIFERLWMLILEKAEHPGGGRRGRRDKAGGDDA